MLILSILSFSLGSFIIAEDNFFVGTFTAQVPLYGGKVYGREPRGPLMEEATSLGVHTLKQVTPEAPKTSISSYTTIKNSTTRASSCSYEPDKWAVQTDSTIIKAIMFYRTTGGTCEECLENCTFQQTLPWVCRSVVFDSRWNICDLFAVTAAHEPFNLATFDGRQYFEYLPALPPSDSELQVLMKLSDRDHSLKNSCPPLLSDSNKKKELDSKHYGAFSVKEQLKNEEKKVELIKKRQEKRKHKLKKAKKSKEILETSTILGVTQEQKPETTQEAIESTTEEFSTIVSVPGMIVMSSTTEDGDDTWTADLVTEVSGFNKRTTILSEDNESTNVSTATDPPSTTEFSTISPKRIAFKGPRGLQKLHGARTSFKEELGGFVDISEAQTNEVSFSICTEDDVVAMVEFISTKRKRPFSGDIKKVDADTTEHCSEICEKDEDCSSAMFTATGCQLASTKAKRTRTDLITAPGFTYIEKICLRKNVAKDRGTLFSAVRNFIIAGFVEEVEDARNLEDCIGLCLKARRKHGFHCLSAMWYPGDKEQNCVLNKEAGSRKPEHFMKADQSVQIVYIEIPDAIDVRERANESLRYKDNPIRSAWTVWSSCEERTKDDMRYRYKKCSDQIDIRKCPRETAFCGPNPLRGPKFRQLDNETNL